MSQKNPFVRNPSLSGLRDYLSEFYLKNDNFQAITNSTPDSTINETLPPGKYAVMKIGTAFNRSYFKIVTAGMENDYPYCYSILEFMQVSNSGNIQIRKGDIAEPANYEMAAEIIEDLKSMHYTGIFPSGIFSPNLPEIKSIDDLPDIRD